MLTNNVNEAAKKKDRLGCFLIESVQTGKSIYTTICLVQLKVNGTALKTTATKVRVLIELILLAYVKIESKQNKTLINF